ncbi:hypothetical protein [Neptuniibacter sp. QD37_11]|uniref:hypothetical protein n=1 Tax=Neptuniibacter sp. QD37_11 TaxID=3398209 RepID=UPI0039F601F1
MGVRKTNANEFTNDFGYELKAAESHGESVFQFSDKFKKVAMGLVLASQIIGIGNNVLASTNGEHIPAVDQSQNTVAEQQVNVEGDPMLRDNIYVKNGILILRNTGDAEVGAQGVTYGLQKEEIAKYFDGLSDGEVREFHQNMSESNDYRADQIPAFFKELKKEGYDSMSASELRSSYTDYLYEQSHDFGIGDNIENGTTANDFVAVSLGKACTYTSSEIAYNNLVKPVLMNQQGEYLFHHNREIFRDFDTNHDISPDGEVYADTMPLNTGIKSTVNNGAAFFSHHEEAHCFFEMDNNLLLNSYFASKGTLDTDSMQYAAYGSADVSLTSAVADTNISVFSDYTIENMHDMFRVVVNEFHSDAEALEALSQGADGKVDMNKVEESMQTISSMRSTPLATNEDAIHNTLPYMDRFQHLITEDGFDWQAAEKELNENYMGEFKGFVIDYMTMEVVEHGPRDNPHQFGDLDDVYYANSELYSASHSTAMKDFFPTRTEALESWNNRVDLMVKYAGEAMSDKIEQHYREYGEQAINQFYDDKMTLDNAKYFEQSENVVYGIEAIVKRDIDIETAEGHIFQAAMNSKSQELLGKSIEEVNPSAAEWYEWHSNVGNPNGDGVSVKHQEGSPGLTR